MARPWRIQFEGAVYHISSRGNNQQYIFLDDRDKRYFLELLKRVCEHYHFQIFAFCLMSNHYHLFLRTFQANLSDGMHWLNTSYSNYFNWRHSRSGHLFQGRFKAVLILEEAHYLHLSMYLHLNPVRAAMVRDPAEYSWSSFRDYTSLKPRFSWLSREEIISHYGATKTEQLRRYRQECLALADTTPSFVEELKSKVIIGSASEVEELVKKYKPAGQPKTVPDYGRSTKELLNVDRELEMVAKVFKIKVEDLYGQHKNFSAKQAAYYHLVENRKMKISEVGRLFEVSPAGVYLGIKRLRERMLRDNRLQKQIKLIS